MSLSARLHRKQNCADRDFYEGLDVQFNMSLGKLYNCSGSDGYRLPTLEEALEEANFQNPEYITKECKRQAGTHMTNPKVPETLTFEDMSVLTFFFGGADSVYFDFLNSCLLDDSPPRYMRGLLALLLVALRKLPVCTQTGPLVFYSEHARKEYAEGQRKFWRMFVAAIEAFEASGLRQSQKVATTFVVTGKLRCYNIGSLFMRDSEYLLEPGLIVDVKKRTESVTVVEASVQNAPVLEGFITELQQQQQQQRIGGSSSIGSSIGGETSKSFIAETVLWNGCILTWAPVHHTGHKHEQIIYQLSRRSNVFMPKYNTIVYEGPETTVEYTDLEPDATYEFYLRAGVVVKNEANNSTNNSSSGIGAKIGLQLLQQQQQQQVTWDKWSLPLRVKTPKLCITSANVVFHTEVWHRVVIEIKIPTFVRKKTTETGSGKSILRYQATRRLKGEEDPQESSAFEKNKITLKNLLPNSEYDVALRVGRTDEEKWSEYTHFTIKTLNLPSPPGLAATARYWHKVKLTWGTPAGCEEKAVLYRVELKEGDKYRALWEGFRTSFVYEKLSPETEYTFRVALGVDGKWSDWGVISARTTAVLPFAASHWKECPDNVAEHSRGYAVEGERGEVATFLGTDCAVVLYETPLTQNALNKWGIRVKHLPEGVTDARGIWIGVAPYDTDQSAGWRNLEKVGWYFWCGGSPTQKLALQLGGGMLFSGPPHNYKRRPYGKGIVRSFLQEDDVVHVEMDMVCGDLSFLIKGEDCSSGPAYTGIPLDVPLVPVVNITRKGTSVEFVPPQKL